MHKVVITRRAEADMQAAVDWWSEHRSLREAEQWYVRILAAIESLSEFPERCRRIHGDTETFGAEVRQLLFGLSAKPTHRVLFCIENTTVTIFRILHTSQDWLKRAEDLH